MTLNRKAKQYARGLFTVAKRHDAINDVGESLSDLAGLMKKEPVFRAFLMTRRIAGDKKSAVVRKILADQYHPIIVEFLIVVLENKAQSLIAAVARVYHHLVIKEAEFEDLTIYSADELTESETKAIVEQIEKKSGNSIRFKSVTDPTLLGGLKLRIGNVFLDASVSNRLNSLKESLLSQ